VGKKHNGANGKFVHYSGHSIVVQLDKGKTFNPSPNSVKLVKPKYRSKIEKTKVNAEILPSKGESVEQILPLKEVNAENLSVKKILSFEDDYSDVDIEKNDKITITDSNAKKGDRVIIVGKINNGAYGKFVHYSGHSIVIQLDKGKTFNPSPNSVKLVKPKYRSKTEKIKANAEILPSKGESVKKILPLKKEKNDRIPAVNYDFIPEKFRKPLRVWKSENITEEVYARMCAEKLFVHIDARKCPEIIKHTNWSTKVNAYMKETGYHDPRVGTLISQKSSGHYEFWECPGGFDFMRFAWSILSRNAGVKYGHMCHISIILDNTCYKVILFL